jgi:hypothetical protein
MAHSAPAAAAAAAAESEATASVAAAASSIRNLPGAALPPPPEPVLAKLVLAPLVPAVHTPRLMTRMPQQLAKQSAAMKEEPLLGALARGRDLLERANTISTLMHNYNYVLSSEYGGPLIPISPAGGGRFVQPQDEPAPYAVDCKDPQCAVHKLCSRCYNVRVAVGIYRAICGGALDITQTSAARIKFSALYKPATAYQPSFIYAATRGHASAGGLVLNKAMTVANPRRSIADVKTTKIQFGNGPVVSSLAHPIPAPAYAIMNTAGLAFTWLMPDRSNEVYPLWRGFVMWLFASNLSLTDSYFGDLPSKRFGVSSGCEFVKLCAPTESKVQSEARGFMWPEQADTCCYQCGVVRMAMNVARAMIQPGEFQAREEEALAFANLYLHPTRDEYAKMREKNSAFINSRQEVTSLVEFLQGRDPKTGGPKRRGRGRPALGRSIAPGLMKSVPTAAAAAAAAAVANAPQPIVASDLLQKPGRGRKRKPEEAEPAVRRLMVAESFEAYKKQKLNERDATVKKLEKLKEEFPREAARVEEIRALESAVQYTREQKDEILRLRACELKFWDKLDRNFMLLYTQADAEKMLIASGYRLSTDRETAMHVMELARLRMGLRWAANPTMIPIKAAMSNALLKELTALSLKACTLTDEDQTRRTLMRALEIGRSFDKGNRFAALRACGTALCVWAHATAIGLTPGRSEDVILEDLCGIYKTAYCDMADWHVKTSVQQLQELGECVYHHRALMFVDLKATETAIRHFLGAFRKTLRGDTPAAIIQMFKASDPTGYEVKWANAAELTNWENPPPDTISTANGPVPDTPEMTALIFRKPASAEEAAIASATVAAVAKAVQEGGFAAAARVPIPHFITAALEEANGPRPPPAPAPAAAAAAAAAAADAATDTDSIAGRSASPPATVLVSPVVD